MNHKEIGISEMLRCMIRRKWKKKGLLTALICLFFFLLAAVPVLIHSAQEYLYRRNTKLYGSYDITYEGLSFEDAEKLKSDAAVKDSVRMWYDVIPEFIGDKNANILYAESSLLDGISNYTLHDGRLPAAENEILCDTVFRTAYPDMIENDSVKLGEKTYQIVGTFASKSNETYDSIYTPLFIARFDNAEYQQAQSMLMLQFSGDTQSRRFGQIQDFLARNHISAQESYNYTALDGAFMQPDGKLEPFFLTVYRGVMLLLTGIGCVFIVLCFWLSLQNLRREIQISSAVGIAKKDLQKGLISVMLRIVLTGILIAVLLFLVVIGICCRYMQMPFSEAVSSMLPQFGIALLPFVLSMAVIILLTGKLFPKNIAAALGNRSQIYTGRRVYKEKSILDRAKFPFLRIAEQNNILRPMQKFLSVAVIALSVCLPVSMLYLFSTFNTNSAQELYDFQIQFSFLDNMESITGSKRLEQSYAMLKELPDAEIFPFFTEGVQAVMKKNDVSEAYRNYRSAHSTEYQKQFAMHSSAVYEEQILLIGTDPDTLQRMFGVTGYADGIPSGECIVVDQIMSQNAGKVSVGIQTGTQITLKPNFFCNESRRFTVAGIAPKLPFYDSVYDGMILLLLNEQDYQNYNSILYPTSLYANTSDPRRLEKFIEEQPEMRLADLREARRIAVETKLLIMAVGIGILSGLLAIICICCYFVLQDQTDRMRGQYAMMEAVGVPFRKISFVQLYSVLSLYWKSIVIGILLSIAACFGIWIMMRESNTFFADFSVKWTQILLTCLVIGLAFAVIAIPLHRLLRKNSILDALQQE